MTKLFPLIVCLVFLASCQQIADHNTVETSVATGVTQETPTISKEEEEEKIWKLYCDLWRIAQLYALAPNSQRYEDLKSNGNDVSSQKGIMPKILAEWSLVGIEKQAWGLMAHFGNSHFPDTVSLIEDAKIKMFSTFAWMKDIQTVDDFKANIIPFATGLEILRSIPEKIVKEWSTNPLFQWSQDTDMAFVLCNNHVDIEFWGGEKSDTSEADTYEDTNYTYTKPRFDISDIHIGITTENLRLREAASTSAKILTTIPKWTYVSYTPHKNIINDGYTWAIVWYYEKDAYWFAVLDHIDYIQPVPQKYRDDHIKNNQTYYKPPPSYRTPKHFHWYECTSDCSWHEAWYDWAERKWIDDIDDCSGNSQSFIEWCVAYVEENF